MNCDDVFQVLTSSRPHSANGELDRHLAGCRSCREIADLFRPAVGMLATHADDRNDAEPSESWRRVWDAVAVAERAAEQLGHTPPSVRSRPSRLLFLSRSAALIVIGITLGGVMTWAGGLGGRPAGNRIDGVAVDTGALDTVRPTGRCDELLRFCRQSLRSAKCPTCGDAAPPARINVVALCTVCHALPSSASESADDGLHTGWLRPGGMVDSVVAGPNRT
jgi:hypothetical protein